MRPLGRALDLITRPFGLAEHPLSRPASRQRAGVVFVAGAVGVVVVYGAWRAVSYVERTVGVGAPAELGVVRTMIIVQGVRRPRMRLTLRARPAER